MTKNVSMGLIFDSWRIASTIEDRFRAWRKDQTRNDWWSLKFKTTMPFLKKEKGDTTKSRNTGQHIHLWTKLACLILVGMQCYCCCLSSQEVHSVDLSAQSWWALVTNSSVALRMEEANNRFIIMVQDDAKSELLFYRWARYIILGDRRQSRRRQRGQILTY